MILNQENSPLYSYLPRLNVLDQFVKCGKFAMMHDATNPEAAMEMGRSPLLELARFEKPDLKGTKTKLNCIRLNRLKVLKLVSVA